MGVGDGDARGGHFSFDFALIEAPRGRLYLASGFVGLAASPEPAHRGGEILLAVCAA